MAIGRYRDDPESLDEVEQRVAAAQYPEGGLATGAFLGVVISVLTSELLLAILPVLGCLVGFWLGRRYRRRKVAALRAARSGR